MENKLNLERIMNKGELIELMIDKYPHLPPKQVENAVKSIFELMVGKMASGERIEIRGFGSFSLRHRKERVARNPKTGEKVQAKAKIVPHFKPGKELKERVNGS